MLDGNVNQITWDQVKMSFYSKFFSANLRDVNRQEFLDLKQGQMTVDKYDQQFDILSHFASELVDTEHDRVERFVRNLRNDTRYSG